MKRKSLYISIATFIILSLPVFSSKAVVQDENRLLIRMDKVAVVDDSLRLDGFFRIPRTQIPSTGKLMFTLSLEYGGQQLELPPVVIAGKRRMRYELREQTVNPDLRPEVQPAVTLPADWKKTETMDIRYRTALPYASWMQHAGLRLEQWVAGCCREERIASDLLSEDIDLDYECSPKSNRTMEMAPSTVIHRTDTVFVPQPPAAVALCLECTVVYIDFPQGSFSVRPAYKGNRRELLKVDSLMQILPAVPFSLMINSYASPEGTAESNDLLAYRRMQGFTDYLLGEWILPANCRLSPQSRGEDWDGLLLLLNRTRKPYARRVAAIIEEHPDYAERKRLLRELDNGTVWNDMLNDLFPLLRRIELKIVTE